MVKLYTDASLRTLLPDLDLGTVEVGTTQQFTVYAHNETIATLLNIVVTFNPRYAGLEVISAPETIGPNQTVPIVIRWSPPLTLRKALETTVSIRYKELYVVPKRSRR